MYDYIYKVKKNQNNQEPKLIRQYSNRRSILGGD